MCYQRVKARWRQAIALLRWFIPTPRLRWALGLLLAATLVVAGYTERRRRDELIRAISEQGLTLDNRLRDEMANAAAIRLQLQERIDNLDQQVSELKRRQQRQAPDVIQSRPH